VIGFVCNGVWKKLVLEMLMAVIGFKEMIEKQIE